jgi:hypothetical protein
MTERTTPLLGLPCDRCSHVEGLHSNPATHITGSSACAACECPQYVGESDRSGKREPSEPVMTDEDRPAEWLEQYGYALSQGMDVHAARQSADLALKVTLEARAKAIGDNKTEAAADLSVDPFDCLAPTRKNFASAAHALTYYEARMQKAREAQRLLEHGAVLARTVLEHADAAAGDLAKLTPAELRKLGMAPEAIAELEDIGSAPAQLAAAMTPMVHTFEAAAKVYAHRAQLLATTVTALLHQAQRDGSVLS